MADANGGPSVGEVARGQAALSEQIHRLHEETVAQHHRVRNDMATGIGRIEIDVRTMMGEVKAHEERLRAQGREIGGLTKDVHDASEAHREDMAEIRADAKKLLWSIIGAYGLVTLAVIGVLLGKVG